MNIFPNDYSFLGISPSKINQPNYREQMMETYMTDSDKNFDPNSYLKLD